MQLPLRPRLAYSAAVFSGLLYWFAFPGRLQLGAWHGLVALVAFIPMWVALQGQTPKRALVVGLLTGTTMNVAGFTWLVDMLQTFSGFSPLICVFFAVLVCTYQGGRLALMGWLHGRSTARGWPPATVFVAAFIASELAYPLLFPWYFAATTYQLPALSQTAELGGPILVGAILVGVNVALAEPLLARLEHRRPVWSRVAVPLTVFAAALVFAAVRIPQVDAAAQAAEAVHVGVVQGNLGLIEKREDPAEGLRRHMRLTNALKAKGADLVVWSESSVTIPYPERGYAMMMRSEFAGSLGVPAIFGAVLVSVDALEPRYFNTALSVDSRGQMTGRYDKEFLLAFGEYLPFGEMIPKLYEWSPNSGHFTPGTVVDPLPITIGGVTHPVSVLICYEDILPSFTNHVVSVAKPELLVNMSNDAWFGDTAEPWEHLALAQLRTIEHRRYLVRSTNSGVSAIVDPVGRVIVHGATFDEEALDAIVHWMHGGTLYEVTGDIPWGLLTMLLFVSAFVQRKKGTHVAAYVTTGLLMTALATGCSSGGASVSMNDGGGLDAGDGSVADVVMVDDAPPTGDASGPVDAGVCPAASQVDFGGPICNECATMMCCAKATQCYALDDGGLGGCARLADCVADCIGIDGGVSAAEACNTDCLDMFTDAKATYQAMEACIAAACMNDAGTAPCNGT
jgi:apolipoprotein N-acyltransferase